MSAGTRPTNADHHPAAGGAGGSPGPLRRLRRSGGRLARRLLRRLPPPAADALRGARRRLVARRPAPPSRPGRSAFPPHPALDVPTHTAELRARSEQHPRRALNRRVRTAYVRMCRRVSPTVVVEIGAHEAAFSRRMKAALPQARVVAYEANPFVHRRYAEEATAAGVEYLNLAVAPVTGEIELSIPASHGDRELPRDSRMASLAHNPHASSEEKVSVPAVRLADHLRLAPEDRVVAWIDVEGANREVLEASEEVLRQTALVYIEVESTPIWDDQWLDTDVVEHLAGLGFVPVLRDAERPQQYNLVLARRRLLSRPWLDRIVARAYEPAEPEA